MSLVFAWLGIIVVIAEGLYRFKSAVPEIGRKIVHIGTGNVILLAWWFQIPAWVGIAAAIIAGAIALISYQLPILPSINSVGRKSLGTLFYAVSIGVLIAWFWPLKQPQYAAMGILIMAWGDGLAALIGQKFGRHPYQIGNIQKSWEGSLTMLAVSALISSLILLGTQGNTWQTWFISITVALIATILEAFSKIGVDNLTVPLASATVGFFLTQWLMM